MANLEQMLASPHTATRSGNLAIFADCLAKIILE
jgi:hypothetical protein